MTPHHLGTFKSQNLRAAETMDRLAYGNSATQDMLWVLIAAGACIYAISFFATQEWAAGLNLPV